MSAAPRRPVRLRVEMHGHAPDPALLRPAIEARLAGRSWAGPESAVADAVVRVAGGAKRGSERPWR